MGMMGDHYRHQMQALLPQGTAWPRDAGSLWSRLLAALAEEFARIDDRARALIGEADPRTTADLLSDWERVAGLPDTCSGLLADTQQGRRHELVSKLVGIGGQSRAYFIGIAASLGFDVIVEEFVPFRAGFARAGDALTNGDWRFTWRVRGPAVTVIPFRAGKSAAGEPLASWGNAGMECRIRSYKPAHTRVIFAYGGRDTNALLTEGGGALITESGTALIMETK